MQIVKQEKERLIDRLLELVFTPETVSACKLINQLYEFQAETRDFLEQMEATTAPPPVRDVAPFPSRPEPPAKPEPPPTQAEPPAKPEPPPGDAKNPGKEGDGGGGGGDWVFLLGGLALGGAVLWQYIGSRSGATGTGCLPCGNTGKCCPESSPWLSLATYGCVSLYYGMDTSQYIHCYRLTLKLKK